MKCFTNFIPILHNNSTIHTLFPDDETEGHRIQTACPSSYRKKYEDIEIQISNLIKLVTGWGIAHVVLKTWNTVAF